MAGKKALFFSGSAGLGHVTRDLAIAKELRRQNPELEISWLAASPADQVIRGAGERFLPEAADLVDLSGVVEHAARGYSVNLIRYAFGMRKDWARNVEVLSRVTRKEKYDILIGDETYEVIMAFKKNPRLKTLPFVMIYDFIGFDSMSSNPLEKLGVYLWNRVWSKGSKHVSSFVDMSLFVGELEDIPDKTFGFLLPRRHDFAKSRLQFTGYIFQFDPAEYADPKEIRKKLGYGKEPLVICSSGGTSIGKELLELCGQSYSHLLKRIPDLRMVLVCGPRLSAASLDIPEGVEVREYVPALYEHFAACDLAIVQGGGTSTLELTALRRPFLFFPIEGHCEQSIYVSDRLARHRAGVKMLFSGTTPSNLADVVIANMGMKATYPPIPVNGAQRAAQLISQNL